MENIKHSLKLYVENKIPTGGFLRSVLENDLFGAMSRADWENKTRIHEICEYIYNELPSTCWGSKEIVDQWLNQKIKNNKIL